jgi:hypothetical protein
MDRMAAMLDRTATRAIAGITRVPGITGIIRVARIPGIGRVSIGITGITGARVISPIGIRVWRVNTAGIRDRAGLIARRDDQQYSEKKG